MLTKIMSNATCSNCGATLIAGAKFCRQCGRLVGSADAQSVAEATTRTLHAPAVDYAAPPTDFFPSQPTSPAYMSPADAPPPAYNTRNLKANGPKANAWLMSAIALVLLGAVITLGIILFIKSRPSATVPSDTGPKPPTVTVPGVPPPNPPKPPSAKTQSKSIASEFIYPGAETVMEMTNKDGGYMLQLKSNDSYEKVLDWYTAKLKPGNIMKSPGPSTVLKSDKLMAIINGADDETHITLKPLDDMDIDINLDR